jgi:hypothetical protein
MIRKTFNLFSLTCLLILQFTIAIAQQADRPAKLYLKSGVITLPAGNARTWADSTLLAGTEPRQVIIHFTSLPTDVQKQQLASSGITLLDYVPENSFTAIISEPAAVARTSVSLGSIINVQPEWKADKIIWRKVAAPNSELALSVSCYRTVTAAQVRQVITTLGGQVEASTSEPVGIYRVHIAANKVRSLAAWYGVRYLSPLTDMVPLDLQSRPAVRGNIPVASIVNGGYDLHGDSVTVGVGDNASGIYHIDIKERITNFNPAPQSHHGEHVNGIVGGAAIVDPLAATMASRCSLVDFLYDMVLPATGAMYHDHNMTISNNSYSVLAADCDYSGTYDGYSYLVDTLALQYPNVLHVFASGNDGWMDCSPYPHGFATVAGGYQPAKNNVVVGSMTDFLAEADDESRGPMKDGRMKPDIVAVGLGAYSTIGVDDYEWAAGTSMASPQVASGLAILTQQYKRLNGGVQPTNDKIKAILLNGAMDLGNPGPDFSYGFGSMDVSRSLKIIDGAQHTANTVSIGEVKTLTVTVPPNIAQFKTLLCWSDAPASPAASQQLVNDLDITIIDPSGNVHKPLVPDPTPANVNAVAVEREDHLNNAEQVTIQDPTPGTYTISVKGYAVPVGPQRYAIAWDFVPKGVQLTFPLGGEQLYNTDTIRVFWNAIPDGNTYSVDFSSNDGANWINVASNIPAGQHYCPMLVYGFNSGRCLVRVQRGGETVTSSRFSVNSQPVVSLSPDQCPGYMNIHWSPVPGATAYILLRKIGRDMQAVDTVTDTTYSFGGLSLTERSYAAVQPIIDGVPGYRSVAAIRVANSGNCLSTPSGGDVMIEKLLSQPGGRMFTSTQPGSTTAIQVRLRNLYTSPTTNYTVWYAVNGGPWLSNVNPGIIPAAGSVNITLSGIPTPAPGAYHIVMAIQNQDAIDPQPANDTLAFTFQVLPNAPISLASPYFDGFEDMPAFSVSHDSLGVSPNGHWDYFNTDDSGRMRSFVNSDITLTGNRSVSLDESQAVHNGSNNGFVGTFNLGSYDTATTEVRVDFDYLLHSIPVKPDGNIVYARGNDIAPWYPLYQYDFSAYPGIVTHVRSRSLTDAVRLNTGNFTTSTQVSFWQNDTSLIATREYGNGLTIDNFRMYTVVNDAELVQIVSPTLTNCGLPAEMPLTVQVHNGVNYTLHNVALNYQLDGGAVRSAVLDSIGAKDTVNFTFPQVMSIAPGSSHNLNVWLVAPGDTYTPNDSITNFFFRNSLIVGAFPYLENFETGDGGYYSAGINNSWQYGTPSAFRINRAASGTKAWKTSLAGKYHNLEQSHLYTPCFDIASLQSPMLSFSAALDIENCGDQLCDEAFVEYSFDGTIWHKLGSAGLGTNWYDSTFNVWNTTGFTRWHVASIGLPQPPVGQTIRFRFALMSDPGVTFEGMAVDDVHIFDRLHGIAPATGVQTVVKDITGNQWNDYLANDNFISSVSPTSSLSSVATTLYAHDTLSNPTATQYTFPRSYTIKSSRQPGDSVGVRLFLTDSEVVQVLADTNCPSCSPVRDAYILGITEYSNSNNRDAENGSLGDDTGGVFTYRPYASVKWVPYDNGYYAEFKTRSLSEFWFNDGGPTGTVPAGVDYLSFMAFKAGSKATAYWYSLIDTAVNHYQLEKSDDNVSFTSILDTTATHGNPAQYSYTDPVDMVAGSVRYYRLKWTMTGHNTVYYSPVRRVSDADSPANLVQFDARMVSSSTVLVSWRSFIDALADHYILERAVENGSFTQLTSQPSLKLYGQQYDYNDVPGESVPVGALIHYRLTVVLADGSRVVLPVRTVKWLGDNAVVDIYPNPTHNGVFTVKWFADAGSNMELLVNNAVGQTVYRTAVTSAQWSNTTTFQLPALAKGLYFVRMGIEGRQYIARLVYE